MPSPLRYLTELTPPPSLTPTHADWAPVEAALHRELPADYKALVNTYGPGSFCEYITLMVPAAVRKAYDIVKSNDGHSDFAAEIWEDADEKPYEFSADLGYELVLWARTIDGDTLNWLAHPDRPPTAWRTLLVSRDVAEAWEHHDAPATAVLLGLLTGDIESDIITPDIDEPSFTSHPVDGD